MVKETRFYDALGVAADASIETIKKAYKKLALKLHPDKNQDDEHAAEKFKELSYMFSVLEDPKKRETYDRYGEQGLKEGGGERDMGDDLLSRLFGFGGMGGGRRGPRRGEDVVHPMAVTLEQLYNGATKKIAMKKTVLCADCHGQGGSNVESCDACQGRGVRVEYRQFMPGMVQQVQVPCRRCEGTGDIIAEKDVCKGCKGQKTCNERKIYEVHIDPGMREGQRITFQGEADESPGIEPGDLVVVLQQKSHDVFVRDGMDLRMEMEIELVEALCGFQRIITRLDGHQLLLTVPPGQVIADNAIKRVPHEGMPQQRHIENKGDLIISFKVKYPEALAPQQCAVLEKALGPKPPVAEVPAEAEEVHVTDVELGDKDWQDLEDDDDDESSGPGVECRSQ